MILGDEGQLRSRLDTAHRARERCEAVGCNAKQQIFLANELAEYDGSRKRGLRCDFSQGKIVDAFAFHEARSRMACSSGLTVAAF